MAARNCLSLTLLVLSAGGVVAGAGALLAQSRPSGALPAPSVKGERSLEEVLAARRSVRRFQRQPLGEQQIAQLCWAAQGVTEPSRGLRTAPSAGATYPLELFVVTADGVSHYVPADHALRPHLTADVRRQLQQAALGQASVGDAPAVFAIAGVVQRTQAKYGPRAERYVAMEAGHAAQNLLLQATALGLGGVPVGAFQDADVAKVLNLPVDFSPLYLIPVGRPAGK